MNPITVIYGSRVCPFTGGVEAANGRFTIWQDLFRELEKIPPDVQITCNLYGPEADLRQLVAEIGGMEQDVDKLDLCFTFPGETAELCDRIQALRPDVVFLNSDDDAVFAQHLDSDPCPEPA